MAVTPYLVSFLRYSEILVENHDFFHTTMHSTPPLWGLRRNIAIMFSATKTGVLSRWWKKFDDNYYVELFRQNTSAWQMDKQTDRQTSWRRHSPRYAWHRAVIMDVIKAMGKILPKSSTFWVWRASTLHVYDRRICTATGIFFIGDKLNQSAKNWHRPIAYRVKLWHEPCQWQRL